MKNNLRKRLLDWCPQPRQPIQTSVSRLSTPIIASVLVVEILTLLVFPMIYAFLTPKPELLTGFYGQSEKQYPLSNSQIAESWPNLPSAKEITEMGYSYGVFGPSNFTAYVSPNNTDSYTVVDLNNWNILSNSTSSHVYILQKNAPSGVLSFTIENCTEVNLTIGGLGKYETIPRSYNIWLPYNSTIWIQVPQTLLTSTSNPPQPTTEKTGFLGTNLPTAYVILATTIIAATALAFAGYLISKRKRGQSSTWTPKP